MKKLLIILATSTLMVSCQWWHETISSPERCAEWYCEEMLDALKAGNIAKYEELEDQAEEWLSSLDQSEQERAIEAIYAWEDAHEKELEKYDY